MVNFTLSEQVIIKIQEHLLFALALHIHNEISQMFWIKHCCFCRDVLFSPEELIAMMLQKAKDYAETFAGTIHNAFVLIKKFYYNVHKFSLLCSNRMSDF